MPETLTQMITAVASRGGYHLRGLASSGTTTTLYADKLIHRDGYWKGKYIYFLSGSNLGLERYITEYKGKLLTFDTLPYNVSASSEFELSEFAHDDILLMIQEAIGAAGADWIRVVVDETIALNTSTQTYLMPADLVSILSIDYFSAYQVGQAGAWIPLREYSIHGAAGARVLQIPQMPQQKNINAGVDFPMRIQYAGLPVMLAEAANTLNMGEVERTAVSYIHEMALHYLNEQRFERNRTSEDARACLTAAQQHMAKAEQLRSRARSFVGTRRYSTRSLPRHI